MKPDLALEGGARAPPPAFQPSDHPLVSHCPDALNPESTTPRSQIYPVTRAGLRSRFESSAR